MKRALFVALGVAGLVTLAAGWFAPGLIAWYYTPPVELGVSCKPAVEWGIATYRKVLVAGAGGGFVLGIACALALSRALPKPAR